MSHFTDRPYLAFGRFHSLRGAPKSGRIESVTAIGGGQCAEERSASLASGPLMLRKGNAVEIALNGAAIEGVDVGGGAHHQSGLFDAMRSW